MITNHHTAWLTYYNDIYDLTRDIPIPGENRYYRLHLRIWKLATTHPYPFINISSSHRPSTSSPKKDTNKSRMWIRSTKRIIKSATKNTY